MFNFFKKKNKRIPVLETEIQSLKLIFAKLPVRFHFISEQLNTKFLTYKYLNPSMGDNWISFGFEESILEEIERRDKSFQSRKVSNILIHSQNDKIYNMELYFLESGIFLGFKLEPKIDLKILDFKKIDTDNILEKIFVDENLKEFKFKVKDSVNKEIFSLLDLSDSFILNFYDKELKTIKYFGNGNYICIDQQMNIFKAIHDPFDLIDVKSNLKNISLKEFEKIVNGRDW